jgi:regulator of sigma D
MSNLNYGDLILIEQKTIGKFIYQRPNGRIVYDKLYIDKDYIRIGRSFDYDYVYHIELGLAETVKSKVKSITKAGIVNIYDKLIEKEEKIIIEQPTNIDKIDKIKSSIVSLKQEIENTKKKSIDEDTEDIVVKWENKVKSIKEREKAIRHLENKLASTNKGAEEEYKKKIEIKNGNINRLRKEKECILKYLEGI